MASIGGRLKHAWNVFLNGDDERIDSVVGYGSGYTHRPDRVRMAIGGDRSILAAILTRIAIDAASVKIRHVRLDDQERFVGYIDSGIDECLNVTANIDQSGRALRQDIIFSMMTSVQGYAAVVPIDTTLNPKISGSWDIKNVRVGEVMEWFPQHVRVEVYNEKTGRREQPILPKSMVALVPNPLSEVMNGPNSTLQRLIRKLALLDTVDEHSASGKLDMIIQLPYQIKTETRRQQVENRKSDLEASLKNSRYGIGYIESNDKVIQLNRPVENNLLGQITELWTKLYTQLGLTAGVMDGTAEEAEMLNYRNRTIEPMVGAVSEEMARKWITKTGRSQGQSVTHFIDPFKLVPMEKLAEIADKFTRNEIITSNEMRGFVGLPPKLDDPKADELRNSNMPQSELGVDGDIVDAEIVDDPEVEAAYDNFDKVLDEIGADLGVDI